MDPSKEGHRSEVIRAKGMHAHVGSYGTIHILRYYIISNHTISYHIIISHYHILAGSKRLIHVECLARVPKNTLFTASWHQPNNIFSHPHPSGWVLSNPSKAPSHTPTMRASKATFPTPDRSASSRKRPPKRCRRRNLDLV